MTAQSKPYEYDAFISYNSKDRVFAEKLEKALEAYKPPKDLGVPRRALNIFRYEEDMVGGDYYSAIEKLLNDSAKLIVICSPNSRKSVYVNDEIRRFAKIRSAENIIPVIVGGLPNNVATPEQGDQKAFADALMETMAMPLAKEYRDFNPQKDKIDKSPFEASWYGLLSDLYNKTRREIEERDKKKQARQLRIRNGIVAGVMISLATFAGLALWQRNVAVEERKAAQSRLAKNYWFNANLAVREDDWLKASHFFARSGKEEQDQTQIKSCIFHVHEGNRSVFFGAWEKHEQNPVAAVSNDSLLSPDGRLILTSSDRTVSVWLARDGSPVGQPMEHDYNVLDAAFSPDGWQALTLSGQTSAYDSIIRRLALSIWNAGDGHLQSTRNFEGYFVEAKVIQNGRLIYTLGDDGIGRYHDTHFQAISMKHESPVHGAIFQPNGELILTWSADSTARFWLVQDGSLAGPTMKYEAPIHGAGFSFDGRLLLTWSGNEVYLWNVHDGTRAFEPLKHEDTVQDAALSPDGRRLLTWDGGAYLWHMDVNPPVADTIERYNSIDGAALSPNGSLILTWREQGYANLWRAEDGATLADLSEKESYLSEFGAAFSPDSRSVLTWWNEWISDEEGERKGRLRLWHAQDGSPAKPVLQYGGPVTKAFFDPEGRWIFALGEYEKSRVWNVNDGSAAFPKFMQILPFTDNLTFSPEGSHVLDWSGNSVRLLDISADYDFPAEHLPLLVEIATGTTIDDLGNVTALGSDEWPKRKAEYIAVAERHLKTCHFRNANFYMRQKQLWE